MNVARNVMVDARLVPGGGAVEMALAHVSTRGTLLYDYNSALFDALNLYLSLSSIFCFLRVKMP